LINLIVPERQRVRMDMRRIVGENVKRARIAAGLTQEQLADRSGFSQQYLSGLEGGKRNPTIVTIYEIAQALDVPYVRLVEGRE
jgi:transcriptional regulator with XRE-family HTH domain